MPRNHRRAGDDRAREDYHDPTAGFAGAPPARSALTLPLILASFGLPACGLGAAAFRDHRLPAGDRRTLRVLRCGRGRGYRRGNQPQATRRARLIRRPRSNRSASSSARGLTVAAVWPGHQRAGLGDCLHSDSDPGSDAPMADWRID